jgi:hypothetical protein
VFGGVSLDGTPATHPATLPGMCGQPAKDGDVGQPTAPGTTPLPWEVEILREAREARERVGESELECARLRCELRFGACELWAVASELWSIVCESWAVAYQLWSMACEL